MVDYAVQCNTTTKKNAEIKSESGRCSAKAAHSSIKVVENVVFNSKSIVAMEQKKVEKMLHK